MRVYISRRLARSHILFHSFTFPLSLPGYPADLSPRQGEGINQNLGKRKEEVLGTRPENVREGAWAEGMVNASLSVLLFLSECGECDWLNE